MSGCSVNSALPLIGALALVGIPFVVGVERLVVLLANRIMGHKGCAHMFPERGIGCEVCDGYYWHEDDQNMKALDDRLARIEEAVFPLEPSERIWMKGA